MKRYELEVADINCEHCVSKVEAVLKPISTTVDVNLDTKLATVESENPPEKLLAAIAEIGYPGSLKA